MRLRALLVLPLLPVLLGLDASTPERALDRAFHNLYAPDQLAGVELEILPNAREQLFVEFAYGRKMTDGGTRTLVYTPGGRDAARVLLFQDPGKPDRMFVSQGRNGRVQPHSTRGRGLRLYGSDFSYEDFRTRRTDEYRIEELGRDRIDGEPCRVLRLWPHRGPYRMLLVWLSTERPIIVRTDHFDDEGLWKRYRVSLSHVVEDFEWWVPLEDEMLDLRTGSRTVRRIRNILVDMGVPDSLFSLSRLARGRMPSF